MVRRYLWVVGVIALLQSCGSSYSSPSSSTTTTTTSNSLAKAYPTDLAVTSPTASSSASADISVGKSVTGFKGDTANPPTVAAQQQIISGILDGTKKTDCSFLFNVAATAPHASCYGPSVDYLNYPNLPAYAPEVTGQLATGSLPSGDLGVWTQTEPSTGEACVAAKMNALMGSIVTNINIATDMGAAILCGANVAGKKLPDKGGNLDLSSIAQDIMTTNNIPITVTDSSITRSVSDSADGPVFTMTVTGSISFTPPGQSDQSNAFTMTLKHIPKSEADNSTYKGRLSLKIAQGATASSFFGLGNCADTNSGPTSTTLLNSFSIEYTKSSSTNLTYLLKQAQFCDNATDPFDVTGNVDLSKKHEMGVLQGWANNGNYAIASLNPSDGSGNFAFAWQAGDNDSNTRTLNVNVDAYGSGCGYFGFGPDIASTSDVGSISKMICSWTGPAANHTGVAKAQRECFTKSGGKFVVDTSTDASKKLAITYAPTPDCDKTVANFTYQNHDGATDDNDSTGATLVTNDLITWDGTLFTVPSTPSVP